MPRARLYETNAARQKAYRDRKRNGEKAQYQSAGGIEGTVRAYDSARHRCGNTADSRYGGRGIEFLFSSVEEFIEDIGVRPEGFMLDRIDNDGNYEPGNVRWVTPDVSSRNRRDGWRNRRVS